MRVVSRAIPDLCLRIFPVMEQNSTPVSGSILPKRGALQAARVARAARKAGALQQAYQTKQLKTEN